jgi:glutathione S-transferase
MPQSTILSAYFRFTEVIMITLHHLVQSRSIRIAWLLEELNLPYELKIYQRDAKTYGAPASLKDVHPLGASPVITDGKLTIAESGAIIEYLIDTYDTEKRLKPTDGQALLDYRYWLHFAEGSMMPLLVMRLVLDKSLKSPIPFFIKPIIRQFTASLNRLFIDPRIIPQLKLIDAYLATHDWFAGHHLSGADIQMTLALQLAKTRCDLTPYLHIARYMTQIESLDNYQKAMKKVD